MARREPTVEDLDFEIEFCEKLLAQNERFLSALIMLGDLYTQRGLYEKGLAIDEKLSRLKPEDPVVFYNLACSYSLLNRVGDSLAAIKKAIALGYDDFEHLGQDLDLKNLFRDVRFKEYLTFLKDKRVPAENHE